MSESTRAARGRRRGGRDARRAGGASEASVSAPYIKRKIPVFEVLDEEGLQLIENNAETILEETGIEFRDMPEALDILKQGGAEIDGVTARFPRGLCRSNTAAHTCQRPPAREALRCCCHSHHG